MWHRHDIANVHARADRCEVEEYALKLEPKSQVFLSICISIWFAVIAVVAVHRSNLTLGSPLALSPIKIEYRFAAYMIRVRSAV